MPFTLHTDRTLNYSWRISNRSYAVGSKPRRLPGQLARFASGRVEWDMLFPKNLAQRAKFFGKRQKSTMLPQAKYAIIESKRFV